MIGLPRGPNCLSISVCGPGLDSLVTVTAASVFYVILCRSYIKTMGVKLLVLILNIHLKTLKK